MFLKMLILSVLRNGKSCYNTNNGRLLPGFDCFQRRAAATFQNGENTMKLKPSQVENLIKVSDSMGLCCTYDYIGIRIQEKPFTPGPMSHKSSVWIDNTETEETLGGISAIDIDQAINVSKRPFFYGYPGDHIAIIAGNSANEGNDFGEIVIIDPVVVYIDN